MYAASRSISLPLVVLAATYFRSRDGAAAMALTTGLVELLDAAIGLLNPRVDETSVEVRNTPEPDIWCIYEGRPAYFELGRLLDKGMQRLRIKAMRDAPRPVECDPRQRYYFGSFGLRLRIADSGSFAGSACDAAIASCHSGRSSSAAPTPAPSDRNEYRFTTS